MEKRTIYWLAGIFLLVLTVRLILAFTIPNFTYDSYFHLRQVENIAHTGLPLYHDPLSYGGRELMFLPLFHYLFAFFDLLLPLEIIAKILPNLFLASLTLVVFLLSHKITSNEKASLMGAGVSGFLPLLFYTNSLTPLSLFLPLVFLLIYAFMGLPEKKYLLLYITLFILLSLLTPATFLIIIGLGVYLLLSFLENKSIKEEEKEIMLFSLFAFLWIQFLFFKKIFLNEGISFIWQNIPQTILQDYFPQVNITSAIVLVSIIPFLAGIFIVYRSVFYSKNRKMLFLISLVIATSLLSWLRLIEFNLSLSFFGITLAVLFSSFYLELEEYVNKTKINWLKTSLIYTAIFLLLITMLPPAIGEAVRQDTPTNEEILAFKWLNQNTLPDSVILSTLKEGHLVTYYSQRRNLMDSQFSSIKDIDIRYSDLNQLYTTQFQTVALNALDKYNIGYLVLTPSAKEEYELLNFQYKTGDCFAKVYDNETRIYQPRCSLEETALNTE